MSLPRRTDRAHDRALKVVLLRCARPRRPRLSRYSHSAPPSPQAFLFFVDLAVGHARAHLSSIGSGRDATESLQTRRERVCEFLGSGRGLHARGVGLKAAKAQLCPTHRVTLNLGRLLRRFLSVLRPESPVVMEGVGGLARQLPARDEVCGLHSSGVGDIEKERHFARFTPSTCAYMVASLPHIPSVSLVRACKRLPKFLVISCKNLGIFIRIRSNAFSWVQILIIALIFLDIFFCFNGMVFLG